MFFKVVPSDSLVARIHFIRWISGVGVRVSTPTLAYNNALSYYLKYAHGTKKTLYFIGLIHEFMSSIKIKWDSIFDRIHEFQLIKENKECVDCKCYAYLHYCSWKKNV